MKKLAVLALAVLVIFSFLAGCTEPASTDFLIDSKNYFEIGVPTGSNVFFQAPWYRISSYDYEADQRLSTLHFIIGENVEVFGINTDQLHGAEVSLSQSNLADMIHKDYYGNIYRRYVICKG